jgi:hypothetical protein
MKEHQYCKILVLLSVLTGICFVPQISAGGQTGLFSERDSGRSYFPMSESSVPSVDAVRQCRDALATTSLF